MSDETTDPKTVAADERDARAPHDADRTPTADEARVAEDAAAGIDLARVAEHERELTRLGADVEGEGKIS